MKIVRMGTFETNSSSTHSITMSTKEDFKKWENGELVYDDCEDILIPVENKLSEEKQWLDNQYKTPAEFFDNDYYETFKEVYKSPTGEEIVAFGYYGYDG